MLNLKHTFFHFQNRFTTEFLRYFFTKWSIFTESKTKVTTTRRSVMLYRYLPLSFDNRYLKNRRKYCVIVSSESTIYFWLKTRSWEKRKNKGIIIYINQYRLIYIYIWLSHFRLHCSIRNVFSCVHCRITGLYL